MSPGRQLALWWGVAALCVLALAPLGEALAAGLPACAVKAWTGLPCPGCGTTRAALGLARLDLAGAVAVNPAATLGWLLLVGGGLGAGALALSGRELPTLPRRIHPAWRLAAAAALVGNWAYLLAAGV